MKSRSILVGLSLISALTFFTVAQGQTKAPSSAEIGALKCRFFNAKKGDIDELLMATWIQGALSGVDILRVNAGKQKSLINVVKNGKEIIPIIRDHCAQNDENTLSQTATITFASLNEILQNKPVEEGKLLDRGPITLGIGNEACSVFNAHKKDTIGSFVLAWFQGELKGMSDGQATLSFGNATLLDGVRDRDALNKAFIQQCHVHPTQEINEAGALVYLHLKKK